MDDLIERLRNYDYEFPLLREAAADTIERQAALLKQCKEALKIYDFDLMDEAFAAIEQFERGE